MTFVSYAQNFEDVLLWRALGDVENGFYVDVGAQDPVIDSVSLAFYERGWRGVHIEPSPQYAERLRQARPDEDVIERAVAAAPGTLKFFEFPGTGLGTADRTVAEQHQSAGFSHAERTVECRTLTQLLEPHARRDIHWMKIDVEGLEREVIEGWDPSIAKPWILVIEATQPLSEAAAHESWESLVLERGYDFAFFDGLNRYYVSREHLELKARLRCPANVFDHFELSGTASNALANLLKRRISQLERSTEELGASLEVSRESHRQLLSQLSAMKVQVASAEADKNARLGQISALTARLADAEQEKARVADQIAALESEVAQLNHHIAWQEGERSATRAQLAEVAAHLETRIGEIQRVYGSWSWRLTRPLRLFSKLCRTVQGYRDR